MNLLRALKSVEEVLDGTAHSTVGRRESDAVADLVVHLRGQPQNNTEQLLRSLASIEWVESVRASRGRITIRLADSAFSDPIDGFVPALRRDADLGECVVDYCDPNANKPLHTGHLRNVLIGNAIASLLSNRGWTVTRQIIINDTGRSIAEAVAGYMDHYAGQSPTYQKCAPAQFVGRCYAAYGSALANTASANGGDAPIAREVAELGDRADEILKSMWNGELDVVSIAQTLCAWAWTGQSETLTRLGGSPDICVRESAFVELSIEHIRSGVAAGLYCAPSDRRAYFPTGTPGYERLPLARSDGFPTEHTRAIAIWDDLLRSSPPNRRWVHIVGAEWAAATAARLQVHERLVGQDSLSQYQVVHYGMVTQGGEKIKSHDGQALALDDLLDRVLHSPLAEKLSAESGLESEVFVPIVLGGYLLSKPTGLSFELDIGDVLTNESHSGWTIAKAYARAISAPPPDRLGAPHPATRTAAFRALELRETLAAAADSLAPSIAVKFLSHMAQGYLRNKSPDSASSAILACMTAGLTALGLVGRPKS